MGERPLGVHGSGGRGGGWWSGPMARSSKVSEVGLMNTRLPVGVSPSSVSAS